MRSDRDRLDGLSTQASSARPATSLRRSRLRELVLALDQQPLRLLAAAGALQGEAALQLLAVEDEDGVAALQRFGPGDPPALLVGAAVPGLHPAAVELALEVVVGERVVADLDRQALYRRVHRGLLRHRPRLHRPLDLQPQVEMVGGRLVLLDDEDAGADAAEGELLMALGLDGFGLEVAHLRRRRPLAQEVGEARDRIGSPLGMDEDAAVLGVPHPAENPELARSPRDRIAEADPLDPPSRRRPDRR